MNFRDIVYGEVNTKTAVSTIRSISSGRRHVIKINRIAAEKTNYLSRRARTKNLISSPTDRIAIFANEYVPNHFTDEEWIKYSLLINGKTYDIIPLNSNKPGVKIIKYSKYKDGESHAIILDEPIKEAYLTISIITPDPYETPYLSNLKVVSGKGV
ncbi:hypothetical protein [Lysinibacillus pakistanensis]|uniref:hypothetical protein n=1 Tax=Lysinibacillus pakistanensis TaxID=759811 RepID=UPI003D277A5D